MERAHTLEPVVAAVLAAAGAAIAAISWSYGFGTLARPGPGLYPFFIGLAIVLFAGLTLISALRAQERPDPALDRSARRRLAMMAGIFCFWILAMPALGYVLVTLAATYGFAKTLDLEGQAKPLILAGGTALFIYLLFDYWLYIDLPRGVLG